MRRMVLGLTFGLVCLVALSGCAAATSVQAQAVQVAEVSAIKDLAIVVPPLNDKVTFSPSIQNNTYEHLLNKDEDIVVYTSKARAINIRMKLVYKGTIPFVYITSTNERVINGKPINMLNYLGEFQIMQANIPVQFEAQLGSDTICFTIPPKN